MCRIACVCVSLVSGILGCGTPSWRTPWPGGCPYHWQQLGLSRGFGLCWHELSSGSVPPSLRNQIKDMATP